LASRRHWTLESYRALLATQYKSRPEAAFVLRF
jgi:hypothetical protein